MIRPELVGTTIVRNGGQIVIPAEALDKMGISDGDELVVFVGGMKQRIILSKPDAIEENFEHIISQLKHMRAQYKSAGDQATVKLSPQKRSV